MIATLDICGFSRVNAALGRAAGDQLLVEVGARLTRALRTSDTVARLANDGFALLLPEVSSAEQSAKVIAGALQQLSAPWRYAAEELEPQADVGIALYPAHGASAAELLENASIALRQAQQEGPGARRYAEREMSARESQRSRLEQELRRALREEQFVLHYQPQVDLADGALVGVEALVRWQHPERGLVAPLEFIPLAEESGLIVELGELVLRMACRQARAWQAAGLPATRVAVNVSAKQLHERDFAKVVSDALKESGLAAALLEVEITETALVRAGEWATSNLFALRDLGVAVALDDFGIGYSSLSRLRELPFSRLKIDRSFVTDLPADYDAAAICKAIIAMGRSLSLEVIAEGVETAAQLVFLRENGCQQAQGYLFARPMAAAACGAFLAAARG